MVSANGGSCKIVDYTNLNEDDRTKMVDVATTRCGSGSGGRIAIHSPKKHTRFTGKYSANGGGSSNPSYDHVASSGLAGGPGSVFIADTTTDYKTLIIKNENAQQKLCYPIIDDRLMGGFTIEELHLNDSVRVNLVHENSTNLQLQVNELIGDGSGVIHVTANNT
ncbi:uncharacterized protein LOC144747012 isoform X2 [Ciona intestinalis]